jgi:hypothetical protein
VLLGNGDGSFKTQVTYATGTGPGPLAIGDFNGDGLSDLALVNSSLGVVGVLLNTTTQTATAVGSGISIPGTGTHQIEARYSGDSNFGSSTSGTIPLTASQVPTTLTLASSLNPSNFGQSVTFTATVTAESNNGTPTGTVGFFDGTTSLGSSVLGSNGMATFSISTLAVGTHGITASYGGDANFAPSTSPVLSQVVQGAIITLSPGSLTFPTQLVFSTSTSQTVTLSNTGAGTLTISSIVATGQFSQTNTCGSTVNPGTSCTISVTFKPISKGALTGSIAVADNAPGSPHKVTLTGTGTYVQLAPTSLNFGTQPVGTRSLPKRVTLTNKGSIAVSITSITITGVNATDFSQTNTCGNRVAAGASCFIRVTFTPKAKGNRAATISVNDNGGGSPQKVSVSGTGT